METTKLIEENKENFDNEGFLNYKKIEKYFLDKQKPTWGSVTTKAGKYCFQSSPVKIFNDAEIFFSQYYSKFGIKTPINFMVSDDDASKKYLVGEDLSIDSKSMTSRLLANFGISMEVEEHEIKNSTILAKDFYSFMTNKYVTPVILEDLSNCNPILDFFRIKALKKEYKIVNNPTNISPLEPFFVDYFEEGENVVLKHFTHEAVKKELKMKLLDIATYNNIRLPDSYLYKVNNLLQVEDVIPLDSGNSAVNVDYYNKKQYDKIDNHFLNDFDYDIKPAINILKEYQNNKKIKEYFSDEDRLEFAKELKNVTKIDIAKDVEENTNYKIDTKYQDAIMQNSEFMADLIERGV